MAPRDRRACISSRSLCSSSTSAFRAPRAFGDSSAAGGRALSRLARPNATGDERAAPPLAELPGVAAAANRKGDAGSPWRLARPSSPAAARGEAPPCCEAGGVAHLRSVPGACSCADSAPQLQPGAEAAACAGPPLPHAPLNGGWSGRECVGSMLARLPGRVRRSSSVSTQSESESESAGRHPHAGLANCDTADMFDGQRAATGSALHSSALPDAARAPERTRRSRSSSRSISFCCRRLRATPVLQLSAPVHV
jgi:hypothetical protein